MKHCMLMSVLSLLFSLLLPVTVQHAAGISGGEALPEVSPAASAAPESTADAFSGFDALTGVTLLRGGEVETLSMAEYLPGVVAGEMPASFEQEALCAQAVAANLRTRTRYPVCVSTSATGGTFRLLCRVWCAPDNRLSAIDGGEGV